MQDLQKNMQSESKPAGEELKNPIKKTDRELSEGEKAVGLTFNPGGNPTVTSIKTKFAAVIDELDQLRAAATSGAAKRYYSKAISYAEDAQMNGVKAATWLY